MKTKAGLLLVALLMMGANYQDADATKKELAKFAGTWTISELTYNGEDHSKLKFNIVFKGDEAIIEGNDQVKKEYGRFKLKIDPTTKPKLLDISVSLGVQKDTSMEGIYEFKGDDLRFCVKVFGKDRPTEFSSPDGASIALVVLKRLAP